LAEFFVVVIDVEVVVAVVVHFFIKKIPNLCKVESGPYFAHYGHVL
jgi:hypothetical protein